MAPTVPPRRRPKLDAFHPGHVFFMPRGATWLNRDKPRPFVLASDSSAGQLGTFIYGSSRLTELHAGAAVVPVLPRLSGVNANGLLTATFFYPGVMLPIAYEQLPTHAGVLGAKMESMKAALSHALGLDSGTCESPGAPSGSWRGRIVVLHPEIEEEIRTRFAVILTEHLYSAGGRYQVVVPIVRANGQHTMPSVLRVRGKVWIEALGSGGGEALLAPTVIQSVWHSSEIVAPTPYVIDGETLAQVEERLRGIFHLDAGRHMF